MIVGIGVLRYQGIEKSAIETTFRAMKIDCNEENFSAIKTMQDEAKVFLNKQK